MGNAIQNVSEEKMLSLHAVVLPFGPRNVRINNLRRIETQVDVLEREEAAQDQAGTD